MPNKIDRVDLNKINQDSKQQQQQIGTYTFNIPDQYKNANLMIEIVTNKGLKKIQAYYSHSLMLHVMDNYGQIKISDLETKKPLPKTYVKVYAKIGGQVKFYKDGYSDLRGKFDYASSTSLQVETVETFSLLVMSTTHGAIAREAKAPNAGYTATIQLQLQKRHRTYYNSKKKAK